MKLNIFVFIVTLSVTKCAPASDPADDLAAYLDSLSKPVHFQLENPVEPFIGREQELTTIKHTLLDKRPIVITGDRGVGKSELARKYVSENFDGSILWINCTSITQMTEDFKNLHIKVLRDVGEKKLHIIVIDVLKHFKNLKSLFVFDGAMSDNVFITKLKAIVGEAPSMSVIVTSRSNDWNSELFSIMKLEGFTKAEAVKYIKIALKDLDIPTDETKCEKLAETLDYLPLALKHITGIIIKRNTQNRYTIDDMINEINGEVPTTTTKSPPKTPSEDEIEKDLLEKLQRETVNIGSKIAGGAEKAWEKVSGGAEYVGSQISYGAKEAGKEISKAADSVKSFFKGFG